MQIERVIKGVRTLGPGKRMVVWVNGCHRNCPGCVSKRLQKDAPQNEREIESYFDQFNFDDVDGVTISGGEPFDQTVELCNLVRYLRQKNVLDILIYTGYTLEELIAEQDEKIRYILENISVLIDGPYVRELDDNTGNLKGSKNQRTFFLNSAYKEAYEAYDSPQRDMQEFLLGNILVAAGIPTREYVEAFLKK